MSAWRKSLNLEDFLKNPYVVPMASTLKGHYHEIDCFGDCIRRNIPLPVTAVDAARATVCSWKAIESMKSGMPVAIKPADYFMD